MMRLFKLKNVRAVVGPSGVPLAMLAALLIAVFATLMTVAPQESAAKPAYAKSTGFACTACHTTPPKLNACGQKWEKDHKTKC